MTAKPKTEPQASDKVKTRQWQGKTLLPWVALALIVLLAAGLRFANIDSLGYVNHYYAAAVKSMLQSWHNFFFVAAEPGGSVSVDKPPLGLWLQAISAYFLGLNSLGLLLPQLLAGLGSIVLVFHLVRRSFGSAAGLLAALALAITPVVVAADRNNTMDSTMIFTLLLAAWAFLKATETSRLRYLLAGAVLVGLAFNIKMLAAYLPLPAFVVMYLLGAREKFWRKIGKLAVTGLLLLAVSFSWAIAVDLTPEDQRPYVGSSSDNTELTLIFGYNGVSRLLGMARNRLMPANRNPGLPPANPNAGAPGAQPPLFPNRGGTRQPPINRQSGTGGNLPNLPRNAGGGGGGFNIGQPGVLRLFTPPLSKEASWLLPLGLAGLALLLAGIRFKWPLGTKEHALMLWGGWLLTGAVFFSMATFFHEYYLALLGAPIAALAGIGLAELWKMYQEKPLLASILCVGICAITLAFQVATASSFLTTLSWLPVLIIAFLAGTILLMAARGKRHSLTLSGLALIGLSVLITPAIWSVYTNQYAGNNLSLPAAYAGETTNPEKMGSAQVNQKLLEFLQANTQDMTYLMAVPSSMQGADYVLASGRPVLYMGGFNGNDEVVSAEGLAQLVAAGELRYIYWGAQGNGNKQEISTWLTNTCKPVEGFAATTSNFGAPDGTAIGPGAVTRQANNMPISLYDCSG